MRIRFINTDTATGEPADEEFVHPETPVTAESFLAAWLEANKLDMELAHVYEPENYTIKFFERGVVVVEHENASYFGTYFVYGRFFEV
jgi:hypothetical protein